MLTGQVTVLDPPPPVKRSLSNGWKEDELVYVAWNQEPHGVLSEHQAVGEDWIISGQVVGEIPIY